MGDYVALFINNAISKQDPLFALTLFFLFLARFLPIIALAPFFGAKVLPIPAKVALALCMFAVFLPTLLKVTTTPVGFDLRGIFLFCKESFIGFIIGFVVSMPFMIVQSAGIIIDHQRGGSSLMVNDPSIQNQSSPLGTMFNLVLIYLFFIIDGPFLFIDSIITSYEIVPPDQIINANFFNSGDPFWKMQIELLNKMMVLSIQLATPALLIMLMTDLFLGIANRLAPQVQITFLGMPLKSLLGLGIVCLGWNLFVEEATRQSYAWTNLITDMMKMFKPSIGWIS